MINVFNLDKYCEFPMYQSLVITTYWFILFYAPTPCDHDLSVHSFLCTKALWSRHIGSFFSMHQSHVITIYWLILFYVPKPYDHDLFVHSFLCTKALWSRHIGSFFSMHQSPVITTYWFIFFYVPKPCDYNLFVQSFLCTKALWSRPICSFFLGHRSQRLQWPIVTTRCPASVRRLASVVCRLSSVRLFTFSTSSPEPLDGFWWNFMHQSPVITTYWFIFFYVPKPCDYNLFVQSFLCTKALWSRPICSFFLGHRSQRLQWPIVTTRCPASVRRLASVVCRLSSVRLFTFSTSSPEPLDGFWWNLVWMKYSRSLTSVVVFRPDPSRGGSRAGQK